MLEGATGKVMREVMPRLPMLVSGFTPLVQDSEKVSLMVCFLQNESKTFIYCFLPLIP